MEDITEEELENVAITVRDKIYDKVLVSSVLSNVRSEMLMGRPLKGCLKSCRGDWKESMGGEGSSAVV